VDNGLEIIRTENSPYAQTYIGTSTSPVNDADTLVGGFLAQSSTAGTGDGVKVDQTGPNYEYSETRSRRFIPGVGTGPVNSIAMGASINDTGSNIFNRVVLGATIEKAANQALDVIFRLTIWPPKDDVIGTGGTVSTIEGVSYETITRGAGYGQVTANAYAKVAGLDSGSTTWVAYDGDIGLITAGPSGNQGNSGGGAGVSESAYVPGTHYMDLTYFAGLNDWLPGGGLIRSLTGACSMFYFQTQFDATAGGAEIPKDETEIMDQTWRISWDRRP
jgi:hypothetical protein